MFLLEKRLIFLTGKGGVGKTSLACAVALSLSDAGKSVLLVSTDPASNLDEMLGVAELLGLLSTHPAARCRPMIELVDLNTSVPA